MRLNEIDYGGAPPIDSYGPGFFRVGGVVHHGNLLLLDGVARRWDGFDDIDDLINGAGTYDVLFVGTGPDITPLPGALMERFAGIGVMPDLMATPPACRTYNVLLAEGRRIAAALVAV